MGVADVDNILQIIKVNKEMDIVTYLNCINNSNMNIEDIVISKQLENTIENNFNNLKSKMEAAVVHNILQITKVNKEMDIVNDVNCIKYSKMNEEDVVISKQLENTREMNSEHLQLKMKVDGVANIF